MGAWVPATDGTLTTSRDEGFRGSLRLVTEWATRRRRAEKAEVLQRIPFTRALARLMTTGLDALSRSETITITAIEQSIPALVEAITSVKATGRLCCSLTNEGSLLCISEQKRSRIGIKIT